MVRLVDAAMICYALNGDYFPENKRKTFKIRLTETSAYTIEIVADSSGNARDIAEKIFKINKSMFDKEATVKTSNCDSSSNRKRSQERIRQAFSRYDPQV